LVDDEVVEGTESFSVDIASVSPPEVIILTWPASSTLITIEDKDGMLIDLIGLFYSSGGTEMFWRG
jgi:hypothetical protein